MGCRALDLSKRTMDRKGNDPCEVGTGRALLRVGGGHSGPFLCRKYFHFREILGSPPAIKQSLELSCGNQGSGSGVRLESSKSTLGLDSKLSRIMGPVISLGSRAVSEADQTQACRSPCPKEAQLTDVWAPTVGADIGSSRRAVWRVLIPVVPGRAPFASVKCYRLCFLAYPLHTPTPPPGKEMALQLLLKCWRGGGVNFIVLGPHSPGLNAGDGDANETID